jgi:hypothetical protein
MRLLDRRPKEFTRHVLIAVSFNRSWRDGV